MLLTLANFPGGHVVKHYYYSKNNIPAQAVQLVLDGEVHALHEASHLLHLFKSVFPYLPSGQVLTHLLSSKNDPELHDLH